MTLHSAASDQGLHCLPKMHLDSSIWKLKDVEIVLFDVSLQKFLYFDKQSWPWLDTAFCSSRIWIYTVLKCPASAFEQINFKFKL